jgi:ribosome biogenesis GTPase
MRVVVSELVRLGWNAFFERQLANFDRVNRRVVRVIEEQRGLYHVAGEFDGPAEVSGRFRHEAQGAWDFPAVGDWVGVTAGDCVDRAIIHCRLERRSTISRKAAGRAVDEQILAANVDTIFLVTALAGDLNPRRLERYLTLVWEAGAVPVVVLNKADLSEDPAAAGDALRDRLPLVDVVVVSALTDAGLEGLAPYLGPARTVALLGSSGVGKSTLVNRLLGAERQKVAAVREDDGRGRHTTTTRQLVELPSGALLIDTPGMRELQPWTGEEAVDGAFEELAALAQNCRFTDCEHTSEPGCAVLAAVATGALDADRLEHYRRLAREAAFEGRKRDKAAAANAKRHWKQIHQAQKELYKDRDRDRS